MRIHLEHVSPCRTARHLRSPRLTQRLSSDRRDHLDSSLKQKLQQSVFVEKLHTSHLLLSLNSHLHNKLYQDNLWSRYLFSRTLPNSQLSSKNWFQKQKIIPCMNLYEYFALQFHIRGPACGVAPWRRRLRRHARARGLPRNVRTTSVVEWVIGWWKKSG